MKSDPFKLQRLALLPKDDLQTHMMEELSMTEQARLLDLIRNQGLQFLWLEALRNLPDLSFNMTWRETLKKQCLWDTARYMAQKQTLIALDKLFEREHIPYVVFKGAHIREIVYADPAYRPAVDIDLLVSPREKCRVVMALCANGYAVAPDLTNISHEISVSKGNVRLDLHWHIMRPGRTRIDLTDLLLHTRQRCGFFWGLDNEMTLLVMLAHPVFTKYSTAPQSSIVRLVDLRMWISKQEIDWQRLLNIVEDAGLKTASWITSTILADLTGCRIPTFFYKTIRPKHLKRILLQQWLDYNLSLKFTDYPVFSKYIFTLLAHDRLTDVFRFIRIYKEEKKKARIALEEIQKASTCR